VIRMVWRPPDKSKVLQFDACERLACFVADQAFLQTTWLLGMAGNACKRAQSGPVKSIRVQWREFLIDIIDPAACV
jgi:hypothetical protein